MNKIILKISGESLKEDDVVSKNVLNTIYKTVLKLKEKNYEIGIVIGGGNFFRGRSHPEMDTITADTIGMLASVTNALYIHDYFREKNLNSIISTPFNFPNLLTNYSDEDLLNKASDGNIIIFGGGLGLSGYSTDSGAILAAEKLNAKLIVKLTNVDGVYNLDPNKNTNAIKFDRLTYDEVINGKYKVMDEYAFKKCKENNINIIVMNFDKSNNIVEAILNKNIGTIIGE